MAFLDVVTSLNPQFAWQLLSATFQPMDALFYGIALYEGYKLSIHRITGEQLSQFLQSQASADSKEPSSTPSTTTGTL